jgi:hypothetical protein
MAIPNGNSSSAQAGKHWKAKAANTKANPIRLIKPVIETMQPSNCSGAQF